MLDDRAEEYQNLIETFSGLMDLFIDVLLPDTYLAVICRRQSEQLL